MSEQITVGLRWRATVPQPAPVLRATGRAGHAGASSCGWAPRSARHRRSGVRRVGWSAGRWVGRSAEVVLADGRTEAFDAVVLATVPGCPGWRRRTGPHAARRRRGYSFSVRTERMPPGRCLPGRACRCTPLGPVAHHRHHGVRRCGRPLDVRRIDAVQRAVRPLLAGWTGARGRRMGRRAPVTRTAGHCSRQCDPGVYVAGGHGMWASRSSAVREAAGRAVSPACGRPRWLRSTPPPLTR